MTDPSARTAVTRDRYTCTDVDQVEQFLSAAYTRMSLRRPPGRPHVWLQHDATAAPGLAINRIVTALRFDAHLDPPGALMVTGLREGRMALSSRRYGTARVGAGEVVLSPTTGEYDNTLEPADIDVTVLDAARVAEYAVHTCGLSEAAPVFAALRPLSAGLAAHWNNTVAHVHDHLLAAPAASPIVLDSAFRLLAATLLASFPNSALDAATDPLRPAATGGVDAISEARLREVVDYLDAGAGEPIGPAEVAGVADAPYREVTEGLRRRRDTHPARLLWATRLRGAHRDLRTTHLDDGPVPVPAGDVVTAIAARWGFPDLDAFTVAHARAYGETPEETLRNSGRA